MADRFDTSSKQSSCHPEQQPVGDPSELGGHSWRPAGRSGRGEQSAVTVLHFSDRAFSRDWRLSASAADAQPLEQDSGTTAESGSALNKKLRIKLKSFSVEPIKHAVELIIDAANESGARISGPVPLPTRRRIYCVLRSPHVNKDSREHFEIRTHSRLIDIRDLTAQTIDRLMALDIPAGVDANIKIM